MDKCILVDDSEFRTAAIREQGETNYYGRVLSKIEGRTVPVICQHGGSMWLCRECALAIVHAEQS